MSEKADKNKISTRLRSAEAEYLRTEAGRHEVSRHQMLHFLTQFAAFHPEEFADFMEKIKSGEIVVNASGDKITFDRRFEQIKKFSTL